jgi:hypothetical protein
MLPVEPFPFQRFARGTAPSPDPIMICYICAATSLFVRAVYRKVQLSGSSGNILSQKQTI